MCTLQNEGLDTRRIILLRTSNENHLEALLGLSGDRLTLPEFHTSRSQRGAEQLTTAVKQACGIEATSVTRLATDGNPRYEIMEPYGMQYEVSGDYHWASVRSSHESQFYDRNDFRALKEAEAQSKAPLGSPCVGPFARLGWFNELVQWVHRQIGPRSLHFNGKFRQLNAGPTFSLIRFETTGTAVWFKAVGEPNLGEFRLTEALSKLFPPFMPELIATRPEWNAWLTFEAEGTLLDHASGPAHWIPVARDLAALQIASLDRDFDLLESGACDLRLHILRNRVEPFFQTADELMKRQVTSKRAALSRDELRELSARILDALDDLGNADFPWTLGHLDLNPCNVIISPGNSVFLDWAEGFIGHPFWTFHYLLEHFRRVFGQAHPLEAQLLDSYFSAWRGFVSDETVRRARRLAPLLAAFTYATSNQRWKSAAEQPRMSAQLRSLTRRMYHEAQLLSERSLL